MSDLSASLSPLACTAYLRPVSVTRNSEPESVPVPWIWVYSRPVPGVTCVLVPSEVISAGYCCPAQVLRVVSPSVSTFLRTLHTVSRPVPAEAELTWWTR